MTKRQREHRQRWMEMFVSSLYYQYKEEQRKRSLAIHQLFCLYEFGSCGVKTLPYL